MLTGLLAGLVHVLAGSDHLAAVAPLAAEARTRGMRTGTPGGSGTPRLSVSSSSASDVLAALVRALTCEVANGSLRIRRRTQRFHRGGHGDAASIDEIERVFRTQLPEALRDLWSAVLGGGDNTYQLIVSLRGIEGT